MYELSELNVVLLVNTMRDCLLRNMVDLMSVSWTLVAMRGIDDNINN